MSLVGHLWDTCRRRKIETEAHIVPIFETEGHIGEMRSSTLLLLATIAALLLPAAAVVYITNGTAAAPPTAPGDVKALCDLYFATGGANWKGNTGFNTCKADGTAGSDPCDGGWVWGQYPYSGVTSCDMTGQSSRVTIL